MKKQCIVLHEEDDDRNVTIPLNWKLISQTTIARRLSAVVHKLALVACERHVIVSGNEICNKQKHHVAIVATITNSEMTFMQKCEILSTCLQQITYYATCATRMSGITFPGGTVPPGNVIPSGDCCRYRMPISTSRCCE